MISKWLHENECVFIIVSRSRQRSKKDTSQPDPRSSDGFNAGGSVHWHSQFGRIGERGGTDAGGAVSRIPAGGNDWPRACISNSSKLFGELYNDTASECDDTCSVAELGLRVFHVEMDDNEDWCVSETLSLCRRPVGTMIGTVMVTLPNPSALLFT